MTLQLFYRVFNLHWVFTLTPTVRSSSYQTPDRAREAEFFLLPLLFFFDEVFFQLGEVFDAEGW